VIYLFGYLGIGVAVLLIVYISHRLSVKSEPDIADILESVNPARGTWHYKLLNNFIAPLLAAILLPFVWPIVIYWKAKEKLARNNAVPESEEKGFSVNREHLKSEISIKEVELQERISDPLSAVPDIPFGFLNAAWERFKSQFLPGDTLWTFSAMWDQGRFSQRRYGYAILRANEVPHYFMAGWETIELPPKPPDPEPTFEELERQLTDRNSDVRWSAVYDNKHRLTAEQIQRGQRDKDRLVRFAFAKRCDLELTPHHIELGLTDKDDSIREIYAYRGDYNLTPQQIERGLTDKRGMIRLRVASRSDVAGCLSPAQIERGLQDEDYCVRWHFAELQEYIPTSNQIERGLTDPSEEVRKAFVKRKDVTFTKDQIARGLVDDSISVRDLFSIIAND
jgi:hypothetical protein